jgi:hypothetical protein
MPSYLEAIISCLLLGVAGAAGVGYASPCVPLEYPEGTA